MEAAETLTKLGSSGQRALINALADDNQDVRSHVELALERRGDAEEFLGPVLPLLKNGSAGVRSSVVTVLGYMNDQRAVDAIVAALEDLDSGVRWRAASALDRSADRLDLKRNARATAALGAAALGDIDALVRGAAAAALRKADIGRVVEILGADLKRTRAEAGDATRRLNAAEALAQLRDSRAIEPLMASLPNEEEPEVRGAIVSALRNLVGKDLGPDPDAWLKWWAANGK
jgi:HEAT repeat protein